MTSGPILSSPILARRKTGAVPSGAAPSGAALRGAAPRGAAPRGAVLTGAMLAAAVALVGCTATSTVPPARTASVVPTPTPTPSATIDLDGDAAQNLRYFDQVNKALVARGGTLDGRAFIDGLVAAGYPKSAMEVTPDKTTVDLDADNIEFSVRLGSTCLIGEYGNIGYASTTERVLSTGHCLAGTTRRIDW